MKRFGFLALAAATGLVLSVDAHALNALTYQQAVARCMAGDRHACRVVQAYERAAQTQQQQGYRGRRGGGSPADAWVSPDELRGERPGVLSTYDFIR